MPVCHIPIFPTRVSSICELGAGLGLVSSVLAAAHHPPRRLLATDGTERERITRAYRLTLGRAPSSSEAQAISRFLDRYEELTPEPAPRRQGPRRGRPAARDASPDLAPRSPEHAAWAAFCQSLFQTAEFRTLY